MKDTTLLNTRLFATLSEFSEKDLKRFKDFVHSPFFCKNGDAVSFIDLLYKNRNKWDKLTKQIIFKHVFGRGAYSETKVNRLITVLMDLVVRFLEELGFEQSIRRPIYGLKVAARKEMSKLLSAELKKYTKKLDGLPHNHQYHRALAGVKYLQSTLIENEKFINLEKYEEQAVTNFEVYLIGKYLRDTLFIVNSSFTFKRDFDFSYLEFLLSYVRANKEKYEEYKFLDTYLFVWEVYLMPEGRFERLDQLLGKLEANEAYHSIIDLDVVYITSVNIVIDELNAKGGEKYLKALYDLYRRMFDKGIHIVDSGIKHMSYKNLIAVACRMKDFDWAREILEEYKVYLGESVKQDAYFFGKSMIYYFEGNYEEALFLLNTIKMVNEYYVFNTKTLQLKMYYELKEYNLFLSCAESFRMVLMRSKDLPEKRRVITGNFIKYCRRLGKVMSGKRLDHVVYGKKMTTIKNDLLNDDNVVLNKKWLLELIDKELDGGVD